MTTPIRTAFIFVVVSLALVVTGANYTKHQEVLRTLEQTQQEKTMQSLETTWKSEGLTMTLKTPRHESELPAPWMARHKEALDAAKVVFPVDPPAGG